MPVWPIVRCVKLQQDVCNVLQSSFGIVLIVFVLHVLMTVMYAPMQQIVQLAAIISIGKMKYVCQIIVELSQRLSGMELCAKIVYQDVMFA